MKTRKKYGLKTVSNSALNYELTSKSLKCKKCNNLYVKKYNTSDWCENLHNIWTIFLSNLQDIYQPRIVLISFITWFSLQQFSVPCLNISGARTMLSWVQPLSEFSYELYKRFARHFPSWPKTPLEGKEDSRKEVSSNHSQTSDISTVSHRQSLLTELGYKLLPRPT